MGHYTRANCRARPVVVADTRTIQRLRRPYICSAQAVAFSLLTASLDRVLLPLQLRALSLFLSANDKAMSAGFEEAEDQDGIRLSWNVWTGSRIESARTVIPIGAVSRAFPTFTDQLHVSPGHGSQRVLIGPGYTAKREVLVSCIIFRVKSQDPRNTRVGRGHTQ